MIYIFQGCGAVCKAPCYLCQCCAKSCDAVCKGLGDACRGCTKACEEMWAPILQNPLGGYVISTWVAMLFSTIGAVYSFIDEEKTKDCQSQKAFLIAMIVIGVLHAVFAFYIQRRLVNAVGVEGRANMDAPDVWNKAKEILKYDVGLCLYIFFFIAAFCYACYGIGDIGKCPKDSYTKGVVAIMIMYQVCAWNYGFCWFCGTCCWGKAKSARVIERSVHGVTVAKPVDAGQP